MCVVQKKFLGGFPILSALDISAAFFALRLGRIAFMGNVSASTSP